MEFYHGVLPSVLRYSFSFQRAVRVFSFGDCLISTKAEKHKEGRAGVCSENQEHGAFFKSKWLELSALG
jgi:hypothetical protein